MKAQKIFTLFFALCLASETILAYEGEIPPESGLVTRVYDGDTIAVNINGKENKVRLLGIDTPEKKGPYTKEEPMSADASRRTAQLALNKIVTLVYGGETLRDRYKRLLAHVILPDGRTLNEILLKEGLAEVFRKFRYSNKALYFRLQKEARRMCVGIWKMRGQCLE
ncbi:hypothetical protein MNBD_NITROSPINAE02-392 [hydrothermal vent metagenome]|uniref:TNase-like domain-containing protein n=1 Tax=hydrothermal vent metagenome TaxID=652676 RepID=A0A3B1C0J1_9ZZZZ